LSQKSGLYGLVGVNTIKSHDALSTLSVSFGMWG
jgi:hypothetical protein